MPGIKSTIQNKDRRQTRQNNKTAKSHTERKKKKKEKKSKRHTAAKQQHFEVILFCFVCCFQCLRLWAGVDSFNRLRTLVCCLLVCLSLSIFNEKKNLFHPYFGSKSHYGEFFRATGLDKFRNSCVPPLLRMNFKKRFINKKAYRPVFTIVSLWPARIFFIYFSNSQPYNSR